MNRKLAHLLFLFFISATLVTEAGDLRLLVKEEAALKAQSFLTLIPEGREKDYGFELRSDFSRIKIEEPYQTYYVSSQNENVKLVPGNEWRVPVSVDGRYKTLLTVQVNNGKAEVVDLGGNVLAQKLQEFEKLHPELPGKRVVIRNTYLNRDYIPSFADFLHVDNIYTTGALDRNDSRPLYQLNEGLPLEVSIQAFCEQTLDVIHNTNDTK